MCVTGRYDFFSIFLKIAYQSFGVLVLMRFLRFKATLKQNGWLKYIFKKKLHSSTLPLSQSALRFELYALNSKDNNK